MVGDRLQWRGMVVGSVVLDAIAVPRSSDAVLVLDWSARPSDVLPWHPFANLVRITSHGEMVWSRVPPPSETLGSWTAARFEDGQLLAWAWQSVSRVDAVTGEIASTTFTS